MSAQLKGRKVVFLAADGVEQVELTAPWNALKQAGADVTLLSDRIGEIQAVNHDEKGDRFSVDGLVSGASARDFDALVLPGSVANPDKLRNNADAVKLVREFMEADKPVAAICRGPWLKLVELLTDAIEERRLDKMIEQTFPASDPLPGPIALG